MPTRFCPIASDSPTRRTLQMIAGRGPMTVRELVEALGVTTTAVREQVNRLHADGWLIRSQRRGRTGRPADVFALSANANRLFAGELDEFARLLIEELEARSGPQESRELLKQVGRRMVSSAGDQVGDGPPKKRLQQLGKLLAQRGDLVETEQAREGLRLTVHHCPYGSLADRHEEICEMEREAFGEMIGSVPRLEKSWSRGHRQCEFTFQPASDESDKKQPTKRR